jgi:predicted alpha/beta hydrolase family esterase
MKNAYILHGKPKKERYLDLMQPRPTQANWLPWLAGQLCARGVITEVPSFPRPYAPDYSEWKKAIDVSKINEETTIVGHSAGAGFILRLLSENKDTHAGTVVLVAPWHDRNHEYGKDFFDYEMDPNLSERVGKLAILSSRDDGENIQESVSLIRGAIPGIQHVELDGFGHFMLGNNMTTTELPEILPLLLDR